MRRPSEKGIYDSTKGQLVDQCWELGLGQPSLSVTEAVSFVVLGSQTCYAIHGPFRDIATRGSQRAFSDFILIILKAASF